MGTDVYVALLRGINMGGRKKLPMKDLVAPFEAAGCGDAPYRLLVDQGLVPAGPEPGAP